MIIPEYKDIETNAQCAPPFGMLEEQRITETPGDEYRFGFNGMERDDKINGIANSLGFSARMYDPRLGWRYSRDPLQAKYPDQIPYVYTLNNPLIMKSMMEEKSLIWMEMSFLLLLVILHKNTILRFSIIFSG